MSEFSTGFLVLKDHEQLLSTCLNEMEIDDSIGFVYPVNEKWVGLLLADEWLMEPKTVNMVAEISRQMPLLYFFCAEDHVWGFRVYNLGDCVLSGVIPLDPEVGELELAGTPSAFGLFGFDEDKVNRLNDFLSSETGLTDEDGLAIFKELLELVEFGWMSYSYLIDEGAND